MTRNPANNSSADDSWEQLEADLFGVEAGKEYTAAERVASEPAPDVPSQPDVIVAKPIEDDDFGDFGAGLVEPAPVAPRRAPAKSKPPAPRAKPVAKAPEPEPVKASKIEPPPAVEFGFDDSATDEDLDAASDDDEVDDEVEASAPEDDPYWDALANWNWQEDDRSGKPRGDASRDRPRQPSRSDSGGPRRSDRSRSPSSSGSSERRSPPSREARPAAEERTHSAHRRSPVDRDRSRSDEALPVEPVIAAPQLDEEPISSRDEAAPEVKSRRQDRRRSRRHSASPAQPASEAAFDNEPLEDLTDDGWPADTAVRETPRSAPIDEPRSRSIVADDLDEDFEDESGETAERAEEASDEEGQPRRRRSRRRRRRPDRPAAARVESPADEDIKELEEDPFVSELDDEQVEESASDEAAGDEEGAEGGRPGRARRPRRRRRGGRSGERPAPAPAPVARVEPEPEFDDEEEDEVLEADDPFFEDRDREFVEEDEPPRQSRRRRGSSSRPATVRATHTDEEDDEQDEDDGEPEALVSYEDVPSWEEAISYLLNPSLVEGAGNGGDRAPAISDRGPSTDRGHRGGGDRGPRPPRRGPRRDA